MISQIPTSTIFELPIGSIANKEVVRFLRSLNVLRAVPDADLFQLASYCKFSNLAAGQIITTEGEEQSLNGFIVVSGCLAMHKSSVNGKELIVELLQAGDVFGLLLMLAKDKLPAQLSARAIHKSMILWVPLTSFTHLLKSHPLLFKEFVAYLLISLQSSYRLARGLAHDQVAVRISAVLSSLAMKFSKDEQLDPNYTIHFTRQQLADLTGTTPETAIRVTKSMQREGLIEIKRPGVIRILNMRGLHEIIEG